MGPRIGQRIGPRIYYSAAIEAALNQAAACVCSVGRVGAHLEKQSTFVFVDVQAQTTQLPRFERIDRCTQPTPISQGTSSLQTLSLGEQLYTPGAGVSHAVCKKKQMRQRRLIKLVGSC